MPRKPLDDLQHGLRVITDRLRVGGGDGGADWIADQLDALRKPPPPRSMEELQAELDSLVGLESVKEQVRALVAFLQVQGRRAEHGLPEVATSKHLVFLGNPGPGKTPDSSPRCTARWASCAGAIWSRSTAPVSSASTSA